jgi:hypothetical protein
MLYLTRRGLSIPVRVRRSSRAGEFKSDRILKFMSHDFSLADDLNFRQKLGSALI